MKTSFMESQKVAKLKELFWRMLNPFVPNASFLYPLKTSENLWFADVFRGQKKGALGTNG